MVDEERLTHLLERIQSDVDELQDAARRPSAEVRADGLLLAAVKYRFVTAIGGCAR